MAEQNCVCGHVWGDPVPTNCRVLKAAVLMVRMVIVPGPCTTRTISYGSLGPRAIWYT